MLELRSVRKQYGDLIALDSLSLRLEPGEFLGLLGPNGAGKSTLMSIVSGFRAPDSGEVLIGGERFTPASMDLRGRIGLVPQSIALYEDLTAEENLDIFGRLYGLRGAALKDSVRHGLESVQLAERRRDKVKSFSGGMQRRLNLAAALLHRPRLLLCDEPTVGVDPQSRNAIFELLAQLNAQGMTVIYSTHYMEEATRLCSRIGIIDHGRILALGTSDQLLNQLPFTEEIRIARTPETEAAIPALAAFGQVQANADAFIFHPPASLPLSTFFAAVEKRGLHHRLFQVARPTLEDLFLHLTGKTLRDD